MSLYDGDFNLLASFPFLGFSGAIYNGGMVFSSDGRFLYTISNPNGIPVIFTIDVNTFQTVRVAPALGMIPVLTELSPPFFLAEPFAVDSTGLVLGIQDYGVAFDDSTFAQNYVTTQGSTPVFMQHMTPYAGPDYWWNDFRRVRKWGANTAGCLVCSQPGDYPSRFTNPDHHISPPAQVPGPVNLKDVIP